VSLANDPAVAHIEEVMQEEGSNLFDRDDLPEHVVLIGYLIISEWAGDDGETYINEIRPERQTYWRTLGYLDAARLSTETSVRNNSDEEE
jgi:hypothetical protein